MYLRVDFSSVVLKLENRTQCCCYVYLLMLFDFQLQITNKAWNINGRHIPERDILEKIHTGPQKLLARRNDTRHKKYI